MISSIASLRRRSAIQPISSESWTTACLIVFAFGFCLSNPADAGCELPNSSEDGREWSAVAPHLGPDTSIHDAIVWDDGSGASIFIAGAFRTVEDTLAPGVARWNGNRWFPVSEEISCIGFNGMVQALETFNGRLFAAGQFTQVDVTAVEKLAFWNGSSWSMLPNFQIDGEIHAMVEFEGELIIAGEFTTIGSLAAQNIARWNGDEWSTLEGPAGNGTNGDIVALTIHQGALYAGGRFSMAGGQTASNVARWDELGWSAVAGPDGEGTSGSVHALASFDGQLIVGGSFWTSGGVNAGKLVAWDGTEWHSLPAFPGHAFAAVSVESASVSDSRLYVAYSAADASTILIPRARAIAVWDGLEWSSLTAPDGQDIESARLTTVEWQSSTVLAGFITSQSATAVNDIIWKTGSVWAPLTSVGNRVAINQANAFLHVEDTGESYVAGSFATQTHGHLAGVARVTDRGLSIIGSPFLIDSPSTIPNPRPGIIRDLALFDGELHAAGRFNSIGTSTVSSVARWNGMEWVPVGTPADSYVDISDITVFNATLFVGGYFSSISGTEAYDIAQWNGSTWLPLLGSNGSGLTGAGRVKALQEWSGKLFVGGSFDRVDGRDANSLATWDGSDWHIVTDGVESGVDGTIAALGTFGGGLVAGGTFSQAGEVAANNIAIWDGGTWNTLGVAPNDGLGLPTSGPVNDVVTAIAELDGSLFVGGGFARAGSQNGRNAAVWNGSEWTILPGSQIDGTNGPIDSWTAARLPDFLGDTLIATGGFTVAGSKSAWGLAAYGTIETVFNSSFE